MRELDSLNSGGERMMYENDDSVDEYDEDIYEAFGEGFEDEFDAVSEKAYDRAFLETKEGDETAGFFGEEKIESEEYEFDSVVGGRDKKPIMSMLNKGKLSKYEMDDLLNQF